MGVPLTPAAGRKSKASSNSGRSSGRSSKPDSETLSVIARLEDRIRELENRPHPDQAKIADLEAKLETLLTPPPTPASSMAPATKARVIHYGTFRVVDE